MSLLLIHHPKPVVDWNFLKKIPSTLSFARVSSGTYVGADGKIASASANVPRFDHDPATGERLGLLLESQRTNTLYPSLPDTTSAWSQRRVAVQTNQTLAPDGTSTATLLNDNTTEDSHYIFPAAQTSYTSGKDYTFSIYAKAATASVVQLTFGSGSHGETAYASFDLSNGTVGTTGAGSTALIETLGNGWHRCMLTATATATVTYTSGLVGLTNSVLTASRLPSYSGTETGVYLWGAQVETGPRASSFIPTTTATATRAADSLAQDPTSRINPKEGTFYTEFSDTPLTSYGDQAIVLNVQKGNHTLKIVNSGYFSGDAIGQIWADGNLVTQRNPGVSCAGVVKTALRYQSGNHAFAANGLVAESTATDAPTLTDPAILLQGNTSRLRALKYWAKALPTLELQRITQS